MKAFVHVPTWSGAAPPAAREFDRVEGVLAWLRRSGIDSVMLAIGGDVDPMGADELVAAPEPGAVASALRDHARFFGSEPILVIDLGQVEEFELADLRSEHATSPAIATLALRRLAEDGDFESDSFERVRCAEIDRTGRILRLAQCGTGGDLDFATVGAAILEPELLRHVPKKGAFGLETELFPLVLRAGGVLSGVVVLDGQHTGAGPDRLGASR